MLNETVQHLLNSVIPSAREYEAAEHELSMKFSSVNQDLSQCKSEGETAKRKAAQLAVAIDGLVDRASIELSLTKKEIRSEVEKLSRLSDVDRIDAVARINSVANAYKHFELNDPKRLVNSYNDVLYVGAGFGVDGYGVGKFGGPEVIITTNDNTKWKFLGDVTAAIKGWFQYLSSHNTELPCEEHTIWGVVVWRGSKPAVE